jgi:hypothetical protein
VKLTKAVIRQRLVKYFIFRFGGVPADYKDTIKIRRRFTDEAWEGLADTFSDMDLLQRARVVIEQEDMTNEIDYDGEKVSPSTIGHLVQIIHEKATA